MKKRTSSLPPAPQRQLCGIVGYEGASAGLRFHRRARREALPQLPVQQARQRTASVFDLGRLRALRRGKDRGGG